MFNTRFKKNCRVLFFAVISEHFSKNCIIISVMAAKIWYVKNVVFIGPHCIWQLLCLRTFMAHVASGMLVRPGKSETEVEDEARCFDAEAETKLLKLNCEVDVKARFYEAEA